MDKKTRKYLQKKIDEIEKIHDELFERIKAVIIKNSCESDDGIRMMELPEEMTLDEPTKYIVYTPARGRFVESISYLIKDEGLPEDECIQDSLQYGIGVRKMHSTIDDVLIEGETAMIFYNLDQLVKIYAFLSEHGYID